jgi:hypothetical protein
MHKAFNYRISLTKPQQRLISASYQSGHGSLDSIWLIARGVLQRETVIAGTL